MRSKDSYDFQQAKFEGIGFFAGNYNDRSRSRGPAVAETKRSTVYIPPTQ